MNKNRVRKEKKKGKGIGKERKIMSWHFYAFVG